MGKEKATAPWRVGNVRVRRVRGPRSDGQVYWRAVVPEGGKERLVWKGWAVRQDQATSRTIMEAARDGGPAADVRAAIAGDTVLGLLGSWRFDQEQRADLRPKSLKGYVCNLRHLSRLLGDVLVERLDHAALCAYRDRRLRESPAKKGRRQPGQALVVPVAEAGRPTVATRTVLVELKTLKAAWDWGRKRGVVPDRDLDVPEIKVREARPKPTPTRADVLKVLEEIRHDWARIGLMIYWATGARLGEVDDIRWTAIDLEHEVITLNDGKTGTRSVPMPPGLVRALRDELAEQSAKGLFDLNGRVLQRAQNTVRSMLRVHIHTACRAAGLPAWSPQALRRAAVDALYEGGADVGTVAALLGQSPTVALQHYRKARPEAMRRALAAARMGDVPAGEVREFKKKEER